MKKVIFIWAVLISIFCGCKENAPTAVTNSEPEPDSIEVKAINGVKLGMKNNIAYKTVVSNGYSCDMGLINEPVEYAGITFDGMVMMSETNVIDYINIEKHFDKNHTKEGVKLFKDISSAYIKKYKKFRIDPTKKNCVNFSDGKVELEVYMIFGSVGINYSLCKKKDKLNEKEL